MLTHLHTGPQEVGEREELGVVHLCRDLVQVAAELLPGQSLVHSHSLQHCLCCKTRIRDVSMHWTHSTQLYLQVIVYGISP